MMSCTQGIFLIEVRLQHPQMLVTGDASEVLLRLQERRCRPTHRHLSVPPAADAPSVLTNPRVRRVDDVRRRQAPAQRLRQSKAIDGEHLREPFAQARRRRRPLPLQPGGILLQLSHALVGLQLPGRPQCRPRLVVLRLRQMAEHIANLVIPTPLDRVLRVEHVTDGAAQRLGAVDHEQTAAVRPQPALDQLLEQPRRHRRVLRPAFAKTQHVLAARRIHADGRQRGSPRTRSRRRRPPTRPARSGPARPVPSEPASPPR